MGAWEPCKGIRTVTGPREKGKGPVVRKESGGGFRLSGLG